ncbi:MAG TPA: M6 family metalloprotease domain-containing protein [Pseudobacteroides sp.]|uniref:M6 family metalloprotease domain-containing protein n=1 Tax=Pseudobacteroides sp. TaxID=1968840 RepID=UPI002F92D089
MGKIFSNISGCFNFKSIKLSFIAAVVMIFLISLLAQSYASTNSPKNQNFLNGNESGSDDSNTPTYKEVTGLTILIDFSDCPGEIPKEEMGDLINKAGYNGFGNNGSMRDYFFDISERKLLYTNNVYGYYRAQKPKSYYNDINAKGRDKELVSEALQFMKQSGFDFSKITTDNNKMLIAVNVLYAGERNVYWGVGLWPRQGEIDKFYIGDAYISKYQISNIGASPAIGTLVHENCHLLFNYPDLYDYEDDSYGVGKYCVMGTTGKTNPQPPNAFLRGIVSEWGRVIKLNDLPDKTKVTINANSPDVFVYYGPYANEFFVVECIAKKGRWSDMPDEGLAIWHVDVNGNNDYQEMASDRHYKVSLEQADGLFELEKNINGGGDGDLFHHGYKDRFDFDTTPSSRWWDNKDSGFAITDISEAGDTMTFVVHNNNVSVTSTPGWTSTPIPTTEVTPSWTSTQTTTATITATPTLIVTPTTTSTATPTTTPTSTATPTPTAFFTDSPTATILSKPTADLFVSISGYVLPDFFTENDNSMVLKGFAISVQGTDIRAITDRKGYFQLSGLKRSEDGYDIVITKPNYFKCNIKIDAVLENMSVSRKNNPIIMWCGDVNQDGTINLIDVIRLALLFNSVEGDSKYEAAADFNLDGVINLRDFYVVSKHFNQTANDFSHSIW